MTAADVKLDIIHWVAELEDKSVLMEILSLKKKLNAPEKDWWDDLNSSQQSSIRQSIKDAENGRLHTQEEAEAIYAKWL